MLSVFGPGLAINGPLGSMARAAEGLSVEQEHVLASFIVMMMFFAATTVIIFWALMDIAAAFSSTIVMVIASYFWYSYCERIYLRFYWNKEVAGWEHKNGAAREEDADDEDDEPRLPNTSIVNSTSNPLHNEIIVKHVHTSPKTSFLTTLKGESWNQNTYHCWVYISAFTGRCSWQEVRDYRRILGHQEGVGVDRSCAGEEEQQWCKMEAAVLRAVQ